MKTLHAPLCALAMLVLAGCNNFSRNYEGDAYSPSKEVTLDVLDDAAVAGYQSHGFRVIGKSSFTASDVKQEKVEDQARQTAMKKGADVVLLKKEFLGQETVREWVTTGYDSYEAPDGEGGTTYVSVPKEELQERTVSRYRCEAVFLKKPGTM